MIRKNEDTGLRTKNPIRECPCCSCPCFVITHAPDGYNWKFRTDCRACGQKADQDLDHHDPGMMGEAAE